MVLQVAQGIGNGWGSVCREQHLSWSRVIRGLEFVSRGQPESGCPLRISRALTIRSNSAVRVTGVELQEIPQLNYTIEYITTYLQEIPQRIR